MSRHARDMDQKEYEATLAALIKAGSRPEQPPPADDHPRKAKDMTPAEQDAWMKDHRKKFG
jgi:hypothetical protein